MTCRPLSLSEALAGHARQVILVSFNSSSSHANLCRHGNFSKKRAQSNYFVFFSFLLNIEYYFCFEQCLTNKYFVVCFFLKKKINLLIFI